MNKQHFPPPTPEQKIELGILKVKLLKLDKSFNIYTYMLRVNKLSGQYPPITSMITISETALRNKVDNLWPYFNTSLADQHKKEFAKLNINENKQFKNEPANMPQRLRDIFSRTESR